MRAICINYYDKLYQSKNKLLKFCKKYKLVNSERDGNIKL